MTRRSRSSLTLVAQATELALAAPQVVAHRVARMAQAGARPSPRDQREFQRMSSEKVAAWSESWQAMTQQAWRAQQAWAATWLRTCFDPWRAGRLPLEAATQMQRAAIDVASRGLGPVHRKATANARRLGKKPGR